MTKPTAFQYYRFLRCAEAYALEHLRGDLSLGAVARAAGLERKYFSFLFRARTGICFKQWVLALRIEKAKELLRTGDDSITTIALEVGCNDLRTFERGFLRTTLMTPRAFRSMVRPRLDSDDVSEFSEPPVRVIVGLGRRADSGGAGDAD